MQLFQNALTMDPQNVSMLVLVMAAVAWGGVLLVLLVDLFTDEGLSLIWKMIWLPLLLALPVLGGFAYSCMSILRFVLSKLNAKKS